MWSPFRFDNILLRVLLLRSVFRQYRTCFINLFAIFQNDNNTEYRGINIYH